MISTQHFPSRTWLRRAAIASLAAGALMAATAAGTRAQPADPENTLYMDLEVGRVVIKMRPDLARKHVRRIKQLVRRGFYDGLEFFRVEWWVAQTGSPTNDGYGDSGYPDLPAEFSNAPFLRSAVGMARGDDVDSANCQFFIVINAGETLTGNYTLWGYVIEGMEYVDQLAGGEPPEYPDKIVRMQVAADAVE